MVSACKPFPKVFKLVRQCFYWHAEGKLSHSQRIHIITLLHFLHITNQKCLPLISLQIRFILFYSANWFLCAVHKLSLLWMFPRSAALIAVRAKRSIISKAPHFLLQIRVPSDAIAASTSWSNKILSQSNHTQSLEKHCSSDAVHTLTSYSNFAILFEKITNNVYKTVKVNRIT